MGAGAKVRVGVEAACGVLRRAGIRGSAGCGQYGGSKGSGLKGAVKVVGSKGQ